MNQSCNNADYVILSLECFPLIKGFEVQNFELVSLASISWLVLCLLSEMHERKKCEVNFEADYVSDGFVDKNTKSDVHISNPEWN